MLEVKEKEDYSLFDLDDLWNDTAIGKVYLNPNCVKALDTFIREQTAEHFDEEIKGLVADSVADQSLCERTLKVIDDAADTMAAWIRWKAKCRPRPPKSETAQQLLKQMQETGAAIVTVSPQTRQRLFDLLKEERATLERRHSLNPIDRCVLHMRARGEAYDLFMETLREQGLIDAVNGHFGRKAGVIYWYLAHNTASEQWYKDCYADVGLPTAKTAYAHFDNDFDLAKIQLYLTDVDEDNGPFAFVPGSHKWSGNRAQQFVFKQMDRTFKYPKNEELYYRPRFGSPEYRAEILQLPQPLQGSSHFGDDVVPGSDLERELDDAFLKVTADQGNCCVFAGGDLIHYGGLVDGEDRWVLQLGLAIEKPWSAGPEATRSLLRRLATRCRKFIGDRPIDAIRRLMGFNDSKGSPAQNQYKPVSK